MSSATATAAPSPEATPRNRRALPGSRATTFPFWVGLAALLAVALVAAATLGRAGLGADVPDSVLRYQEGLTVESAQNVRRGLNEGVADLAQAAASIAPSADAETLDDVPAVVVETHDRYRAVFVQREDGTIVAKAGEDEPVPVPAAAVPGEALILPIVRDPSGRLPLIQQVAPTPTGGGAVVGHYDPTFLAFALEASIGESWLVDADGRVLSATSGHIPFSDLPSSGLRWAAERARGGAPGSLAPDKGARGDVVSWAPVSGEGPGGQLGLSVVTRQAAGTFSLPATDARREGLVVSVVTAAITVAVFTWLWLVVLAPVRRLRSEAERVAAGELGSSVAIVRYDEVGLTSRALDRLRVLLVGAGRASAPRADAGPAIGRGTSRGRQAAVGTAVVAGFAAFVAMLVGITEYGAASDRAGRGITAPTTTATPTVDVEPVACELSESSVTYRAEATHNEPEAVHLRIEVTVTRRLDSSAVAAGAGEVTVAPRSTASVVVRVPVTQGAVHDDALCVVTKLETSRT